MNYEDMSDEFMVVLELLEGKLDTIQELRMYLHKDIDLERDKDDRDKPDFDTNILEEMVDRQLDLEQKAYWLRIAIREVKALVEMP